MLTNRLLSRHFGGGGGDAEYHAHLVLVSAKFDLLAFFAVVREWRKLKESKKGLMLTCAGVAMPAPAPHNIRVLRPVSYSLPVVLSKKDSNQIEVIILLSTKQALVMRLIRLFLSFLWLSRKMSVLLNDSFALRSLSLSLHFKVVLGVFFLFLN